MSDYRKVSEALQAGAEPEMLCMTCPWDRFCITPPTMTREDIEEQLEDAKRKDAEAVEAAKAAGKDPGMPVGILVHALAVGGKDTSCQVCPVFALRLRSNEGGTFVQAIRQQMQATA